MKLSRRQKYSRLAKLNQVRVTHVSGMGDVAFRGFQCLNPDCTHFITAIDSEVGTDFRITCPECSYLHESGGETKFYDYTLEIKDENNNYTAVKSGEFTIYHDDYINEASLYKYCIICNTLKPLSFFDIHSSRKTGRQGECRLCKKSYNEIKNGTRLSDQHREAAQKRRLLLDVSGSPKIDSAAIEKRFEHKCFNCGKDLSQFTDKREKPLDHTLPVFYLWPLSTQNATLLCKKCNGEKSGKWPSALYQSDRKLKELSVLTGIDYSVLSGEPQFNPEAIQTLKSPEKVNELLVKYANYMGELIVLRNRVLLSTEIDFFMSSSIISQKYIDAADNQLKKTRKE